MITRKLWIIGLTTLLGLALLAGCAKRKNPLTTSPTRGTFFTSSSLFGYPFNSTLADNKLGVAIPPSGKTIIGTYLPPAHPAIPGNPPSFQRYPVLYILADFNQGAEQFGQFYQLQPLVDQLIAAGEIDSLIIIVVSAEMQTARVDLGGTFYADNILIGDWLTYIAEQIIPWVDTSYIAYRTDTTRRAIAGVGMGGYGAFRLALEYANLFDVVGAMSAPLAFGGTDPAGWLESYLRVTVMGENGNNYSAIQAAHPFDVTKPATSWMFAMALGFSPRQDTTDTSGVTWRRIPVPNSNYGVDIPFDNAGLVPSVVDQWKAWDIENLLNTTYPNALSGKKVYLDCGDVDEFDFDAMNRRLDGLLATKNVSHVYDQYSGYPGHDAGHGDFTYDRLRELFKYVSANM